MSLGYDALTEKEKETLRLIVRGHDAKSSARELGLSVHTINERLREARRKLEVTSSREAARLVLETETPQSFGYDDLGEANRGKTSDFPSDPEVHHGGGRGAGRRGVWLVGVITMSLIAAALLLTSPLMSDASAPVPAEIAATDAAVESAARDWLALVDAGNWQASFDAAGEPFRSANTVAGWTKASQQVRTPLGPMTSRELRTVRYLNAPPHGYQEVTFLTQYANKRDVTETVTLQYESGIWRVVGILVD